MTDRPLVSVLTPTWQRHEELVGCVENVLAQTYPNIEHIVVSDGPDETAFLLAAGGPRRPGVMIDMLELGRNWSTYLPDAFCAAPTTVAMLLARGEYQAWLADDERMTPDHIEALVGLLERTGADFAYGRVEMWRADMPGRWVIGTDPPRLGEITNVVYRTELLKRGLFRFGFGMQADWATISHWMSQGATWAFLDRVTLTHRADH